jgi:hypothetical protein
MIILRPVLLSVGVGAGRDYELMPRVTDVLKDKKRCVESFQSYFLGKAFALYLV